MKYESIKQYYLFLTFMCFVFLGACITPKTSHQNTWHKNASMYEVNIRQFTPEGAFNAFIPHLNRIREMGIDILWLMPIHPIGEINRKGSLGSYYSVKDYKDINPEFGNHDDFRLLVDTAHSLGMKVIIDWVANHTAFDNAWTAEHPDWYTLDSSGNIQPPIGTDWWDVVDLNFDNDAMRLEMIDAMQYWVSEFDIDGYRCDVASWVPKDFWQQAIDSLRKVKPVFMLAESNDASLHNVGFDLVYAWEYRDVTNDISSGHSSLSRLDALMKKQDGYRLYFSSNHDENSWHGTVFERYGDRHKLYGVLAFTIDGMPLLYSGQESALNKRLEFFEKDSIIWGDFVYEDFYTKLLTLHKDHPALWNGKFGGKFQKIVTDDPHIYSFSRIKGEDVVSVFLNFSNTEKKVHLTDPIPSPVKELFTSTQFEKVSDVSLNPYGYKIYYSY